MQFNTNRLLLAASALLLAVLASCGSHSPSGVTSLQAPGVRHADDRANSPAHGAGRAASATPPPDSYEPDNDQADADANPALVPTGAIQTQHRTIDNNSDVDVMRLPATFGTGYYFWTSGTLDTEILNAGPDFIVWGGADDEGEETNAIYNWVSADDSTYYVIVHNPTSTSIDAYDFHYMLAVPDAYEPDNTPATARPIVPSSTESVQTRTLHRGYDFDVCRFTGTAGNTYHFTSTGAVDDLPNSWVDPGVEVYDSTFTLIDSDHGGAADGINFSFDFTPASDGDYYVRIIDYKHWNENIVSLPLSFDFHYVADFDPAPTGVTATDGTYTDHVDIDWTAGPGPAATSYDVYRSDDGGSNYNLLGASSDTHHRDFANYNGASTALYAVTAHSATGVSLRSAPDGGKPGLSGPPTATATNGTLTDRVRLTWPAASGAGYYQVFRATSAAGPYTALGGTTGLQYDDVRQTAAHAWYKVRAALGGTGYSAYSSPDEGYAGMSAPTGVAASDGTFPAYVHVAWTAAAGATHYQVFRAPAAAGPYTAIGGATATAFNDHPGDSATYYYKVRAATTGVGYSALSNTDAGHRS